MKDEARRQAIMTKLVRLIGEEMEARGATLRHSRFAKQKEIENDRSIHRVRPRCAGADGM